LSTIGERIKQLRLSLSLNQTDFARRITMSQSGIAGYERNERAVDERIIKLICIEYGVSETWLRTGEGEMYEKRPAADDLLGRLAVEYKMSDAEVAFLEAYLGLPADKRTVLEELIDRACDIRARRIGEAQRAFADSLLAEALPDDQSQAGNE